MSQNKKNYIFCTDLQTVYYYSITRLQCFGGNCFTVLFWRYFPPFCTCYDIPVLMLNHLMIAVISQIPVCLFLTTNIWNTVWGKLGINTRCASNESLLSLRELTYGKCSCRSNCWHRELESSAKDNHSTVFEVVCAWRAFPTAWHFSRQGFWLQITWMLNMANLRTDFQWCPEDFFLWAGHDWFLQSNQLRETVLSRHFLKSRKTHQCYSVTGKTVNTNLEIFQKCSLCYDQSQQRSGHVSKPQNQKLINVLVFSHLIGSFLAPQKHSRNISGFHSFPGLAVSGHLY